MLVLLKIDREARNAFKTAIDKILTCTSPAKKNALILATEKNIATFVADFVAKTVQIEMG